MPISLRKVLLLAVATLALHGCGGGEGSGGGPPLAVAVHVAANPVLVNYSTTVTAAFTAYTSAIRFGSPVRFSVTGAAAVSSSGVTGAGGIATAHVSSVVPGAFTVSASSGGYSGSTGVTFIVQPATAEVYVSADRPLPDLAGMHFVIGYSSPRPFSNVSSVALPALPPGGSAFLQTNAGPDSAAVTWAYSNANSAAAGPSVSPGTSIMRMRFRNLVKVPVFTLDRQSVDFSDSNGNLIPGVNGTARTKYYDYLGNLLFQTP